MVNNIRSNEVKRTDLLQILNRMVLLKKEEGWMDFIEKNGVFTLTFFDNNPKLNNKDAVKISQKKLLKYLIS
jgi:hypothetical protein